MDCSFSKVNRPIWMIADRFEQGRLFQRSFQDIA